MMYACTSWYWLGPPRIGSLYHCTWFVRAYLQDRAMADISILPLWGILEVYFWISQFSWSLPLTLLLNFHPKILHLIQLCIWYHTLWVVFTFSICGGGKIPKTHSIHCCVAGWKCWILDVTDFLLRMICFNHPYSSCLLASKWSRHCQRLPLFFETRRLRCLPSIDRRVCNCFPSFVEELRVRFPVNATVDNIVVDRPWTTSGP